MTRRIAISFLVLISCASFAVAQIRVSRVRVSDGVMQGLLLKRVNPTYPPLARQARIQGAVVLSIVVNKSGDIEDVKLISGHPMLAPAAIESVKQWKYQTYLLNGDPVAVETTVTVNFTLSDNPPTEGVTSDAPGGAPCGQATVSSGVPPSPPVGASHPPRRVRLSSRASSDLMCGGPFNPIYPPDAKAQHIQGIVLLKAIIDKEGNVSSVELISGHPMLAPAAIEAVKQWKYKPFKLNNEPVEVETQVQVNFTLSGG